MYLCIYIYVYVYICIYIYIIYYIHIDTHDVPSQLSPQWLHGKSCTWAHDVWLHIAGTN